MSQHQQQTAYGTCSTLPSSPSYTTTCQPAATHCPRYFTLLAASYGAHVTSFDPQPSCIQHALQLLRHPDNKRLARYGSGPPMCVCVCDTCGGHPSGGSPPYTKHSMCMSGCVATASGQTSQASMPPVTTVPCCVEPRLYIAFWIIRHTWLCGTRHTHKLTCRVTALVCLPVV